MTPHEYYYKFKSEEGVLLESHKEHTFCLHKLKNKLIEKDAYFERITRKDLPNKKINDYDYVISAGGDGTVIALAAYNKNIPQLNIKTDLKSKGALCVDTWEDSLDKILNKFDVETEKWSRLDVYLDNVYVGNALNEICVGEQLRFDQLAKYELAIFNENSIKHEYQRASGLIIATGTGSGAWPGVFHKKDKAFQKLSYSSVMINTGSLISGEADEIKLKYLGHEGSFSLDTKKYELNRNSVLEIKLSKYPLEVIK